jgi:hypothetical protein
MNAQVKIGGDGTTGPVAGAVLELDGARGALLLPRVNDTTAIASPVKGMQVYSNYDNQVYINDGAKWKVYAGPQGVKGADGAPADVSAIPGTVRKLRHYGGWKETNGYVLMIPVDSVTDINKSLFMNVTASIQTPREPLRPLRLTWAYPDSVRVPLTVNDGTMIDYSLTVIEFN